MVNEVETEVKRMLEHQIAKGKSRYGHGLVLNDGHDWLVEAIEECVDQLQYLVAAKLERDKHKGTYVDIEGELKFTIDDTRTLHGLD